MKKLLSAPLVLLLALLFVVPVHAATKPDLFGLKLAPLEVRTELKKDQKRKGFLEVSNPSNKTVTVTSSVRGFRQIDNNGTLQFYQDEQLEVGIRVDLEEFELPPWSAARVYYLLDGTKLPSGDVFAAIFFSTSQQKDDVLSIQPSVRVGTLFSLVNGAPANHNATITKLAVSTFQFGSIKGSYAIKNTGKEGSTGFYPSVDLTLQPFSKTQNLTSHLLFPGRERSSDFAITPTYPGIYQVSVKYHDSVQSSFVFVVTPELLIGLGALSLIVPIIIRIMLTKRSRRPRKYARRPQKGVRRGLGTRTKR